MKSFTGLAVLALAALSPPQPGWALSGAARSVADRQIAAACDGRPGSFDRGGLTEHDLDGDGQDDLILSHEHIECEGRPSRSGFCGAQVCSLQFYVRRGDQLRPAGEILGSLGWIGDGEAPVISTYGHGGGQALWRWNGQEMAPAD